VFDIFRIEIAPQSGPPAHIHRGEDEFFYGLQGQFQFKLGEQLADAPAGSFVFLPRDHVHTFRNIGAETGLLLVGVTPAGLEHFFENLCALGDEHREPHVYCEPTRNGCVR
jgi:quercetin dioxygenase-like cupin family protein